MSLGKFNGRGILEEDEEDEEEHGVYTARLRSNFSQEDLEEARERKAEHVYETFVQPVLEEKEESFTAEDIRSELRPPYSEEEVKDALEYGVEEEGLEYVEAEDVFQIDS
ncbi:MAG: hypothetical protein ABEK04_03890 [Candidatus Nanohalobium sp.]